MVKQNWKWVAVAVLMMPLFLLLLSTSLSGAADERDRDRIAAEYLAYLPLIVGFEPELPAATKVPPTSTPTSTSTSTPTITATATSTSTPTETPTATVAAATSTATATAIYTATPTATVIPGSPIIESFGAFPSSVPNGESALLVWNVSGSPDTLEIVPGIGDVTGKTEIETGPITSATTFKLIATNTINSDEETVRVKVVPDGSQLLIYDWDGPVTTAERGFPRQRPPIENGDWTQPINYANGTLHFRVRIREQPEPQVMNLQYCIWQQSDSEEADQPREMCDRKRLVVGTAGNVVTWSRNLQDFSVKGDDPIDWSLPRSTNGVAIKNELGCPVSNIAFDPTEVPQECLDEEGKFPVWAGEDPSQWYTLDWHVSVINVAEGATFTGWDSVFSD